MEQTDNCQRGEEREKWWKEGEGISQRTGMNDPWTWNNSVGLGVDGWVGWVGWRRAKGGKLGQL